MKAPASGVEKYKSDAESRRRKLLLRGGIVGVVTPGLVSVPTGTCENLSRDTSSKRHDLILSATRRQQNLAIITGRGQHKTHRSANWTRGGRNPDERGWVGLNEK